MIQRRNRARFVHESPQAIGVGGKWLWKDLDRDVAAEARIARAIDLAHAASAKRRQNLVRAETGAGQERHGDD
jgi:hypothetical protein